MIMRYHRRPFDRGCSDLCCRSETLQRQEEAEKKMRRARQLREEANEKQAGLPGTAVSLTAYMFCRSLEPGVRITGCYDTYLPAAQWVS